MQRIGRRSFLARAALAAAFPLAGAAVGACSRTSSPASATTELGQPLPIDAGLAVASDLPVEQGSTLRILEWKDYLSKDVLASFERAYADDAVRLDVQSFEHVDELIARLQDPL